MNGSLDMTAQRRMSPFTALALGLSAITVTAIACGSGLVLYGMTIVDGKAGEVLSWADDAMQGLPEFIESLPPIVSDTVRDRRMPEYAKYLDVQVDMVPLNDHKGVRPTLTITNSGTELVTMLGVRVVALDDQGRPLREWTEVVATPITIDHDWRGPLAPDNKRRVVLSSCYGGSVGNGAVAGFEYEVTDVRVWDPTVSLGRAANRSRTNAG